MDMTAYLLVREVMHGIAEKVSGYGLHDILYELRTIGFYTFPFLGRSDTFLGYGFTTEFVFTNLRFYIAEHSA